MTDPEQTQEVQVVPLVTLTGDVLGGGTYSPLMGYTACGRNYLVGLRRDHTGNAYFDADTYAPAERCACGAEFRQHITNYGSVYVQEAQRGQLEPG